MCRGRAGRKGVMMGRRGVRTQAEPGPRGEPPVHSVGEVQEGGRARRTPEGWTGWVQAQGRGRRESCRWPGPGAGGAEGPPKTCERSQSPSRRERRCKAWPSRGLSPCPRPPASFPGASPPTLFCSFPVVTPRFFLPCSLAHHSLLCLPLFCLSTDTTPKVRGF